jgi:hexokinase
VVHQETERTALQQETEMSYRCESGQELFIKSRVTVFRWRQLFGEKGERPPSAVFQMLEGCYVRDVLVLFR